MLCSLYSPLICFFCDRPSRLACVLIFSCVERVSPRLPRSPLALSSHILVLRVIQGMTHVLLPLGSPASPDGRPRPRQAHQILTHPHPPKSPILPPGSPPPPMEIVHQTLRRRYYTFPTNRTSSGRINRCPNPNLLLCLRRRCLKRF